MIRILFITALYLLIISFSHAQATLEITIKDCREKNSWPYLSELKLYKNDTLYQSLEPKHENKMIIRNLTNGLYRIDYPSIFKKTESKVVDITNNNVYSTELCTDYINYELETYIPFIDRLHEGESYSIEAESMGCFHHISQSMSIENKSGNFYVRDGKKKKQLDSADIEAVRHFEWELNYMQRSLCTTTDTYTLTYKKEKLEIIDGSCNWNGYDRLLEKLNLETDG